MRRPPAALLVAALGVLPAVVGSFAAADAATTGSGAATTPWEPAPIEWSPSPDFDGAEEGWLEVPIDYANPSGGTIKLYVTRHPAADSSARIGTLLVNPGGPGAGGAEFGLTAPQNYSPELVERFDIVGWDPRGAGESTPFIDCIDDYDQYFAIGDITPDDAAEHQQLVDIAEDFTAQCVAKNSAILPYVGTNNSARDMDAIRRALGEDEISYFGFSYGSELGGVWATLFPDTVRAAVLDGASDPDADLLQRGLQQAAGFEATLDTFLARCSADTGCSFHSDGDAESAFDELMGKLDDKPIPSEPDRPDITRGVALGAVYEALYYESRWGELADALAAADDGDGSGLLALWDAYYRREADGTWPNLEEAFETIFCMDKVERPTVAEADATAPLFNEAAPRMAPGTAGGYMCTFYPPSTDPRVAITGAGAGPVVVCGATGDAVTPLASTRNMAADLEDGRMVVIAYNGHTCYQHDPCAAEIIDDYLVNLVAPPEETLCPGVEDLAGGD